MRKSILLSIILFILPYTLHVTRYTCLAAVPKVIVGDEMDDLEEWVPTNAELVSFESKKGIAIVSCDPAGGQEKWGGMAKDFNADVGPKTFIEIKVDNIEPKGENWYMHLAMGGGAYIRIQNDINKTGIFRYKLGKEWKAEDESMVDLTGEGSFKVTIGVTGNLGTLKKVYVDYVRVVEGDVPAEAELKVESSPPVSKAGEVSPPKGAEKLKVESVKPEKESQKVSDERRTMNDARTEAVTIDLCSDNEMTEKYLGDGWWFPEPDARWTGKDKKGAEILVPVAEGFGYDVIFSIAVVPTERIQGDYTAKITVDNEEVKTLGADEVTGSLEFQVPDKFLKPGKTVRVALHSPLFNPKVMGESDDSRDLGLKIKEVSIVPTKRAVKVSAAAPGGKKAVAIFKDKVPVSGTPSNPDLLADTLKQAGMQVKFLSEKEISGQEIFNKDNFDIVILPYGASFPSGGTDNMLRFLRKGGSFISMGGYTFDNLYGAGFAEQIVSNPGFEEGLDGWATETARDGVAIEDVKDVKRTGKASLYIKVGSEAPVSWYNAHYDITDVKPGENLEGSVYIRTKDAVEGAGAYLAMNFYKDDGSRISWVDGGFVTGTSDWVYRTVNGTVPPNTAKIGFTVLLHGYGEAWFDDAKVDRVVPSINTHKAKAADFLEIKPEQIGVFDPSYLLEHVKYAEANKEQFIISPDIKISAELKGYAAIGVTGDNWYCGCKDRSTWAPLMFGYDRFGRRRGAVAAIMQNYRNIYKGSTWVYFGADNVNLFNPKFPEMMKALVDIVKFIERGLYLNETQSDFALYRQGEQVELSAKVSNFGSSIQDAEVKISVLAFDGGKVCFEEKKQVKVEPGLAEKVSFSWKPEKFSSDIYRIKSYLTSAGKTIDCEDYNGFVVWDDAVVKKAPRFTLKDNYFRIGDNPVFLIGAQEFWASASLRNSSPVTIALDYRTMHDYNVRFSRSFMMWASRPPEAEKRFRDAMVYLCQKYGVVMFHEGISDYSPDPKALAKGMARAKDIGERYKGLPLFAADLRNEPSLKPADAAEQNKLLKALATKKYGEEIPYTPVKVKDLTETWGDLKSYDTNMALLNLMKDWAKNLADELHKADPQMLVSVGYLQGGSDAWSSRDAIWPTEGLDFTNRHFYGPLGNFPPEFKEIDMRYQNKPPSTGEFGSKTHPAGGGNYETKEDQYNRYLFITHYVLGLGGGFVSNWHWRDPWEDIFPYGVIHPDLAAKDILKVYRNMSLLFATIQPQYDPPSVYYLIPDNHRIAYTPLRNAIYNGLNQLMDCHLDHGVINEANISKLPKEAKVIIYPLPFMPDDSVYAKLKEFVSEGGILYFSGDISYEPVKMERAKTARLEELAGVKFVEENYKGITRAKPDVRIKPSGSFGLKEYTGLPCIKVKAATAKAVAEGSDGPVAFINDLGKGRVFYTTDPVETSNEMLSGSGVYRAFLNFAGVKTNTVVPDDPRIHVFKVKTSDGLAYVLFNRNTGSNVAQGFSLADSNGVQAFRLADLSPDVSLSLAPFKPGFIHIDKNNNLLGVESQGDVKQGDKTILKTNVHTIAFSLDGKAIDRSDALAVMTIYPGSVTLARPDKDGFSCELGEIQAGKWVTLENIKPASVAEGLKIDLDEDRALEIILVAKDLPFARSQLLSLAGF